MMKRILLTAQVVFTIQIHPNDVFVDPCKNLQTALDNSVDIEGKTLPITIFQDLRYLHSISVPVLQVEIEKDCKVQSYDLLHWRDGRSVSVGDKIYYGYWLLLVQAELKKYFCSLMLSEAITKTNSCL